jgi:rhodanese-related sulfurtransferase
MLKQWSVQELAARAGDESGTPLHLLDVREPWERAMARVSLPGVTEHVIPMAAIPARRDELPRTQPVVCLCHHGGRSAQVVAFLTRHGWTDVYNLAGGIDAWSTQIDSGVPRY